MSTIEIGTAKAAPGTRTKGVIMAGNHPGGQALEIPITIINGVEDGPVLWLNACIHGDEPQGTLAVINMIRELDPSTLKGTVVCVPAMNVPAYEAGKRGNPLDMFAYDMNRIYPGKPDGRYTERLAWAHKEALAASADMEISIHSGGDHSYLGQTIFYAPSESALELAQAMGKGWKVLLNSPHPEGSPMAELHSQGKPAISIELGGICHTMPHDFRSDGRILSNSFWNILYHYKMAEGKAEYENEWFTGSQVSVLANQSGLWVAEEDFEFLKPTKKGKLLARIYSIYGEELEQIKAPCDGMPFGLRTTPVTHAGDWGVFYAKLDGKITKLARASH